MSTSCIICVHILTDVVDPSPSRPPFLLFPAPTMSIIRVERLSSSYLRMCPYQFNIFCLRNVYVWHTLAPSSMTWFLTWFFLVSPFSIVASPCFHYMQSVPDFRAFDRPTLCSIYHCWLDHRFKHLVVQRDGYLLSQTYVLTSILFRWRPNSLS